MPKSDDVYFDQPQLVLYGAGQLYDVKSEARYNTSTRQVFFEKNVVLTKANRRILVGLPAC